MIRALFENRRRSLVLVALSLVGVAATLYADRWSAARANRLHRADALAEAAAIYRDRVEQQPGSARLRYNLGTTLLRQGDEGAFAHLAAATVAEEEQLRASAFYNLALWSLIRAVLAESTDSVLFHAANAVEANKAALRLAPDHDDAKWNLAIAQRVLETSTPEQGLMDPGDISGPDNIGERMETDTPTDLTDRWGEDDVLVVAETESMAGDSLLPLSPLEAGGLLGTSHLDPTKIMYNMLEREGRSRRRRAVFFDGSPW